MTTLYYTHLKSPIGPFLVAGTEKALHFTGFSSGHQQRPPAADWVCDAAPLGYALPALEAYFGGEQVHFEIALKPVGTPFQQAVWSALQAIPYGATRSYGDIAQAIGKPKAYRAVGAANAANHLPVVIPCHRVIGSGGSLTGFGGGLPTKQKLLTMENPALTWDAKQDSLF